MFKKVLATGTMLALAASTAHAQATTLVFDNMDGTTASGAPSFTSTGSTPNTFLGDGYTLLSGTKDITGFDLFPVNLTGTTFTNLQLNVYVWGTVNTGTVSATAPAFSNELAQYTLTSTGPFASGFYYSFQSATPGVTPGITLNTPLVVPTTTIGMTFAYEGSTDGGVTYASVNSLTPLISTGAGGAPTVGSDVFNGYYRNANSETNGNFTSTLRTLGLTNQSAGLRVYGDVASATPEPSQYAAFGLGILGVGALALRARRRGVTA